MPSGKVAVYGQELNAQTWALCTMNMFLHGVDDAKIWQGDTLSNPQNLENDQLMKFQVVVANPPFSLDKWDSGFLANAGLDAKGKKQEKTYTIGEGLWYQMMDMCFPAFADSKLDEILFYPIGTGDNRGAMSLGEFAAKKIGTEKVSIDDKTYSCIKISLVLTMFSWAWTGLFWYDKETNMLIQSGVKRGNKEKTTQTLKEFKYK